MGVLVVEDDKFQRSILVSMLKKYEYIKVYEADDGKKAVLSFL